MKSQEGQGPSLERNDEGSAAQPQQSPAEKLEGKAPAGSTMPGAENPESKEIKKEVNPNTE